MTEMLIAQASPTAVASRNAAGTLCAGQREPVGEAGRQGRGDVAAGHPSGAAPRVGLEGQHRRQA